MPIMPICTPARGPVHSSTMTLVSYLLAYFLSGKERAKECRSPRVERCAASDRE